MFWEEKIAYLKKAFPTNEGYIFEDLYLRGKQVVKKLENRFVEKEWNMARADFVPIFESLNHKVQQHIFDKASLIYFIDAFFEIHPICFVYLEEDGKIYKVNKIPLLALIAISKRKVLIFDLKMEEAHAISRFVDTNETVL